MCRILNVNKIQIFGFEKVFNASVYNNSVINRIIRISVINSCGYYYSRNTMQGEMINTKFYFTFKAYFKIEIKLWNH